MAILEIDMAFREVVGRRAEATIDPLRIRRIKVALIQRTSAHVARSALDVNFVSFGVRPSKAKVPDLSKRANRPAALLPQNRSEWRKLCDGLFLNSSNSIRRNHELPRAAIALSVKLAGIKMSNIQKL